MRIRCRTVDWLIMCGVQGTVLDKHKLALQLSMRKASSAARAKKQTGTPEKQSTKLVVRNVAFEATRKEVMSLFSPFGHMKSCRLPRKFDGTPRCDNSCTCLRNLCLCRSQCCCWVVRLRASAFLCWAVERTKWC